ncbi:DNA primase/polymerase [Microbacterium phage Burro]|uniref:DNA primase/polymerase n=1 Tax=Microbacterium phage Burro TaxID=2315703 RepID=A0A386KKH2_9CAUD|nr:DNA primase/polymerase [Microbacterium phage Burro]AYD86145.1 DNA primase/polymerase [Microbacterium phage Burro]
MGLDFSKKPWYETDQYGVSSALPPQLEDPTLWGPNGPALVKAYRSGETQKGWGLNPPKDEKDGFMPRYVRGEFLQRRALHRFEHDEEPFAFVMRSARIVVVDIDGKNEGLEFVKELGLLPPTLAETSKSGTGYHLFYLTAEAWDDKVGFSDVSDSIGLVQGVDIRNVGCIYHYPQQRWNDREIARVPAGLWQRLTEKLVQRQQAAAAIHTVIAQGDDLEVMMMQDALVDELNKPLKSGNRNSYLFAIGNKMRQAQVTDWDAKVHARALEVGLPVEEADRLVSNISKQP